MVGPGVEIEAIDGASGLTVTEKLELEGAPEARSSDPGPSRSTCASRARAARSVAVQLPLAFAVAVPIERRALVDLDEAGGDGVARGGCRSVVTVPAVVVIDDGADGGA